MSFDQSDSKNISQNEPGLITQIFGESDDENEEDILAPKKRKNSLKSNPTKLQTNLYYEDQDIETRPISADTKVKKTSVKKKKKEEENFEELSNKAQKIVDQMFEAARSDRENYENGKCAMAKIKMIETLRVVLHRPNLYQHYVDHHVHSAIADWLQLLPDGKLCNIQIRNVLLSILESWPIPSKEILIDSGLGRALKNLTQHPQESIKNRERATKIIYKWGKPIYGTTQPSKDIIRQQLPAQFSDEEDIDYPKSRSLSVDFETKKHSILPGDKDFKLRAVQPKPSTTEYVIRPASVRESATPPKNVRQKIKNMEMASKLIRKLKNKK